MVIGLPWYGYNYPCLSLEGNACAIKKVPFRGVNCSDAAGRQYGYDNIVERYIPQAIGGLQWDKASASPFFNYKDQTDHAMHQVWFDNPLSLKIKYDFLTMGLGLRGLAMWNTAEAVKYAEEMWEALPLLR